MSRKYNCACVNLCVLTQPGEKGSPEGERETERGERSHVSFARHLHTHHHTHLGMSYNLMSGQYDIYQGTIDDMPSKTEYLAFLQYDHLKHGCSLKSTVQLKTFVRFIPKLVHQGIWKVIVGFVVFKNTRARNADEKHFLVWDTSILSTNAWHVRGGNHTATPLCSLLRRVARWSVRSGEFQKPGGHVEG